MIIWLIGLAGSGKTTIGKELYSRLKETNNSTVFLDGDQIREVMGDDLGHTLDDREKNGKRICNLSKFFDREGIDVIACVLSLFPDQQQWNRENLEDYVEIYIDVPMSVLEERDQKGLYSGARAGKIQNVVGIDIPFQPPANPDHVIVNDCVVHDFNPIVDEILESISKCLKQKP
jgi:adenylylsulfate kinase